MRFTDPIVPETVILQQLQVAARTHLSPSLLHNMEAATYTDDFTRSLVLQISTKVQAQEIANKTVTRAKVVYIEAPATTWQMFKQTHSDSWWLRWLVARRPVRHERVEKRVTLNATWTGYATFPDSTLVVSSPALGAPIYYLKSDGHIA